MIACDCGGIAVFARAILNFTMRRSPVEQQIRLKSADFFLQ
jgi:hypothetical protein